MPGDITPYNNWHFYSARQKEFWKLFMRTANAIEFGYADCLMPTPGKTVKVEKALNDVARAKREWDAECRRRDHKHTYTGGPDLTGMPVNAQLWLHQEMARIRKLENQMEPKGVS